MSITISEIIKSIKEQNLPKFQLEEYASMLDILSAEYELSLAEIEKEEALYLADCGEKTRAAATTKWDVTENGQKEILLKRQLRAISKLASSVKTRIYQRL